MVHELLSEINEDSKRLACVITADKTWMYEYDIGTKVKLTR